MDYYKDFEDKFSYTSQGAIHFKHHQGTKQKLIFLHGLGSTTLEWERLAKYLPDDLDVHLLDLLGHGESDAPDIDYTVSVQFQALREFISLQNNGDSFLFGHSYGGWVAAYYATQPYTCKGLILEDAVGLQENFDDMASDGSMEEKKEELLKEALGMNNNKEYVMKSIIYSNFEEDRLTSDMLSNIKVPTLILWGAQDTLIDPKYANVFQSKIKGSTVKIIENADHEPHYDQPEIVRDAILSFIGYGESP